LGPFMGSFTTLGLGWGRFSARPNQPKTAKPCLFSGLQAHLGCPSLLLRQPLSRVVSRRRRCFPRRVEPAAGGGDRGWCGGTPGCRQRYGRRNHADSVAVSQPLTVSCISRASDCHTMRLK
jgi:hypothetical protein